MTTTASLFTGGGGFEIGAMMAGYRPVWGVEFRADIAAVAERNITDFKVIVSDVVAVDYAGLPKVSHLHASPSCKKASIANSEGGECEEDIQAAMAVCRAIREVGPQAFTLENVWGYREFESFKLIVGQLTRLGYKVDWWHLNSADYGVPQTRKRLILIARKDRQPRRPQPTHSDTPDIFGLYKPWVGWLEAISDLADTLPESEFAPWQLARLPEELKEACLLSQGISRDHKGGEYEINRRSTTEPAQTITANSNMTGIRALLVPGGNNSFPLRDGKTRSFTITGSQAKNTRGFLLNKSADKYGDGIANGEGPAFTVVSNSQGRYKAFLASDNYGSPNDTGKERILQLYSPDDPAMTVRAGQKTTMKAGISGRVAKMTPRCLARFQSFPDSYELPEQNGLACEIIGNAVPPLLAKVICESLKD